MTFNENEDLNSQSNEDFINEKRFKSSHSDFQIIGSDSMKPMSRTDLKKIQEEKDQTLEFTSFKNYNDYPEDIETLREEINEEGTFNFKINQYNEENKKIIQQLSFMEEKVRGNLDNKNKGYYQNYSFRVAWCRDGFASLGINKCGSYQININKVIIYEEFYKNTEGNFEEYQNIVKDYNKSFSILFKALSEKYDLESVEKNIENLSFSENNENSANVNKYSWPEKQQFMKRIFLYMFKYSKVLNLQKDHLFHEKFYQDEIFNLGLMNILFGNPKIDINRFFKFLRNDSCDEKHFNTLYDTFDKYSQNNANEEYQRKILLNKWLEGKAANVLFY